MRTQSAHPMHRRRPPAALVAQRLEDQRKADAIISHNSHSMKLEQQVCSLDLAKRLKELGVKQESYFHWYQGFRAEWHLGDTGEMMNHAVDVGQMTAPQFVSASASAFTVAELGEMLPKTIKKISVRGVPQKSDYYLDISWCESDKKWRYSYSNPTYNACVDMWFETKEADARAKMLIYLIENKLINA
jgi:hypothetical protein